MARLDRRQAIFAVLAATRTGATTAGTAQPMMGHGSGRGLSMMGGGPRTRGGLPNWRSSHARRVLRTSYAGLLDFAASWSTASNASAAYITDGPAPM